jgi:hypothetical protein
MVVAKTDPSGGAKKQRNGSRSVSPFLVSRTSDWPWPMRPETKVAGCSSTTASSTHPGLDIQPIVMAKWDHRGGDVGARQLPATARRLGQHDRISDLADVVEAPPDSDTHYALSTVMWTTPARRASNPGLNAPDLPESPPRKARAPDGISRRGRRRGTGRRCLATPGGGRCRDTCRRFSATGRRTCAASWRRQRREARRSG